MTAFGAAAPGSGNQFGKGQKRREVVERGRVRERGHGEEVRSKFPAGVGVTVCGLWMMSGVGK